MSYKIVGDSCCDFTEQEKNTGKFISIPLTIDVDGMNIRDDENFNQQEFLQMVASSKECPKSACPTPEDFMKAYEGEEDIYVVTLSSELSGSYNSAMLAKNLYEEEHGTKNIHVFDSKSASAGQLLICRKIQECIENGNVFLQVVEEVEAYIKTLHTYFVLETLDYLKKNGRLTKVQAFVAGALNIKPVMGAENGSIVKLSQARGMKKALSTMLDYVVNDCLKPSETDLVIAHCNCYERALKLKTELEECTNFRSISIVDTHGISSLYAGDGGVVISC